MMTRKMLHHHRRRERGREKKRQLFTCFVRTAVCVSRPSENLHKKRRAALINTVIYIYFSQALYQKQSRSSSVVQIMHRSEIFRESFAFPACQIRALTIPSMQALSLSPLFSTHVSQ
uniref:Uncharacterized protein n=1 Tax=Rhipicephalus microplus TaxID=6941 RepID=A0A6G5AFV3_RHIMP